MSPDRAPHPSGTTPAQQPPAAFLHALHALRAARIRDEVAVEEVRAPSKVAPYAVALAGEVERPGFGGLLPDASHADPIEQPRVTGRFVLLHDPDGQEAWQGDFRAVVQVRADIDPPLGTDPFISQVAWDWFEEALTTADAQHRLRAGTVTRVASQSFGEIVDRPASVELEIRASWTPEDATDGAHVEAWTHLMCSVAGIEPQPAGVTVLRRPAAPR